MARGGRLLVFGAPATVGANFEETELPDRFPVEPRRENLAELTAEDIHSPVEGRVVAEHPVLQGMSAVALLGAGPLQPRQSASVVLESPDGDRLGVASDRVVYLAGVPTEYDQREALLKNFARWCGTELPTLLVSRFENATVAQNWDTSNHRLDGSIIDPAPFVGSIAMSGTHDGVIREFRDDHPWLAYHRDDDGQVVLEGVRLDAKDVKVFFKDAARELPHFEGIGGWCRFHIFLGRSRASHLGPFYGQSPHRHRCEDCRRLVER